MIVLYLLLCFLALFIGAVLFLFVCSLFVSPHREYQKESGFYRFLLDFSTKIGLKLIRIHIHVTGFSKVPKGKPVLFVGNHRSRFDPIVTWRVFRAWKPAFISKPSNFKVPIFGRIIRKCCFMAIDRENPRAALETINNAAGLLARGQNSVGVYPEGTRSKNGDLLPFHNGVFKIAQKANADIVVLAVRGTEKVAKNYPFRRTDIYLDVLSVIPAEDTVRLRTSQIGDAVREELLKHFEKTEKTEAS